MQIPFIEAITSSITFTDENHRQYSLHYKLCCLYWIPTMLKL